MHSLQPPPKSLLPQSSLFLDFDGTLTEFVDPSVQPETGPAMSELLSDLAMRLHGRVAIVSGRSLDLLAELVAVDDIELAGSHGLERRRADGSHKIPELDCDLTAIHEESRQIGRELGIVVEEKSAGAAFHYRGMPDIEHHVEGRVENLADRHQLEFRRGSMVFEVRARGPHKGAAVRTLMPEQPFRDGIPIFIGDDLTDEDGFQAARDLGGHAILVGEPRDTAADYRLSSVQATLEWLRP